MIRTVNLPRSLAAGGLAGLVGGAVITLATSHGALPGPALGSPTVHFLFSAVVGAGFALLLGQLSHSTGYSLMWGLTCALLWWFVAPLTLAPLAAGQFSGWSLADARNAFPLLIAYLLGYGVVPALVYRLASAVATLAGDERATKSLALDLLRAGLIGGAAGYLGGAVLGAWLAHAAGSSLFSVLLRSGSASGSLPHSAGSFLLGALFGMLYRRDVRGAGSSLAWGVAYGYLWWMLGELTLFPLSMGRSAAWSMESGRAAFPDLTGYVIWGLLLGVGYAVVDRVWRELFTEPLPWNREPEGPGARGLRALGLGLWAGLLGGLVYAAALSYGPDLPALGEWIGARTPLAGLVVALVASAILGALYGVLFRRESYSYGAALIWGAVYGSVLWSAGRPWWVPALMGRSMLGRLDDAVQAYPTLLAQIAYGATMALIFQVLAHRRGLSPHPAPLRPTAIRATPLPALWVLVLALSLLLPVLLST